MPPLDFTTKTLSFVAGEPNDGTCFDVELDFPANRVFGRTRLAAAGTKLEAELYLFVNQADGFECAKGAVVEATVTINGTPFAGNAVQTFELQP